MAERMAEWQNGRNGYTSHHLPAVILGFFGGEKKVRQEKSYEKFYRENVPEKPLRTHYDKLSSIISDSSIVTMGIFP